MTIEYQIYDFLEDHEVNEEEDSDEDLDSSESPSEKKSRKFIIHSFGRTLEGKSVYAKIINYTPYFLIKLSIIFLLLLFVSIKKFLISSTILFSLSIPLLLSNELIKLFNNSINFGLILISELLVKKLTQSLNLSIGDLLIELKSISILFLLPK